MTCSLCDPSRLLYELVEGEVLSYRAVMTTKVEAIYENGKLVLRQPLPLPEKAHVHVTVETDDEELTDAERTAWLKVSEQSLMKAWDNADDDVFNRVAQEMTSYSCRFRSRT